MFLNNSFLRHVVCVFTVLYLSFSVLPAYGQAVVPPACTTPGPSHDGTSFGCRDRPGGTFSRHHKGTDYPGSRGCTKGVTLRAGIKGTMTCIGRGDGNGAGNRCAIVAAPGCITLKYFHMDDNGFSATAPRPVEVGHVMGVVGQSTYNSNSGTYTNKKTGKTQTMGVHLHFEVYVSSPGRETFPVSAAYLFAHYPNLDICNNPAAIDALYADYKAEWARCPGQPGLGVNPTDTHTVDNELNNPPDDACEGGDGLVDPSAPPPPPPPPVTPGTQPWQTWTNPYTPGTPGGNTGTLGPLGPWAPTRPGG